MAMLGKSFFDFRPDKFGGKVGTVWDTEKWKSGSFENAFNFCVPLYPVFALMRLII
jgi:hypothetical protein